MDEKTAGHVLKALNDLEAALGVSGLGILPTEEEFCHFFEALQTKITDRLRQLSLERSENPKSEGASLASICLHAITDLGKTIPRDTAFGCIALMPITVDAGMQISVEQLRAVLDSCCEARKESGADGDVITALELVVIVAVAICATKIKEDVLKRVREIGKNDPKTREALAEALAKVALAEAQKKPKTD